MEKLRRKKISTDLIYMNEREEEKKGKNANKTRARAHKKTTSTI
jgi:hypothetical protein